MHRVFAYLIALGVIAAPPAAAQGAPEGWQGGLILRSENSALIGDDRALALPYIAYRTERFSLGFDGARYRVSDSDGHGFDLLLRPRLPSFDEDDAAFAGMSRDIALDFGARYTIDRGSLGISITALQGLTEDQQGQELDLRFSQRVNRAVTVYAGAMWQSDELTEYLYGVHADEVAGGRPAYSPGGALTPYIGVSGALPITDRAVIIGTLEAMQLPDAITDSPIVDDTGTARATVGIVFNF